VIDDFAPQGSNPDVARYHASADKVFRAVGNQAGRGRLDAAANLRDAKPPRSLILSTGEDIPRGHSVRARLLILEVSKGHISSKTLSACQEDARMGLYAKAMAGFLQWIATRYEDVHAQLQRKIADRRNSPLLNAAHARTPESLRICRPPRDLSAIRGFFGCS
jgi:hypothetical protein